MSIPKVTASLEDTVSLFVFWPCTVVKIPRRLTARTTIVFILLRRPILLTNWFGSCRQWPDITLLSSRPRHVTALQKAPRMREELEMQCMQVEIDMQCRAPLPLLNLISFFFFFCTCRTSVQMVCIVFDNRLLVTYPISLVKAVPCRSVSSMIIYTYLELVLVLLLLTNLDTTGRARLKGHDGIYLFIRFMSVQYFII